MVTARQNVLILDFDLGNIRSKSKFFSEMKDTFSLPDYFWHSFDSLNDCMMDLCWYPQNYLLLNFLRSERLQRFPTSYDDIMRNIEIWQHFWHNIENYSVDESYYDKTVVISIT